MSFSNGARSHLANVRGRPAQKLLVAALVVALSLVGASVARAIHYSTGIHWHSEQVTYRLHRASLPTDWRSAIVSAAGEWSGTTRLKFFRGADIPVPEWQTTDQIVWRGSIPSSWQGGCPPSTTLACTQTVFLTTHILDNDMVFNSAKTFTTTCALGLLFIDVETVALHEFGHFGHLGHSGSSADVMDASYHGCDRTVSSHDIGAMNFNYPTFH